MMEVQVGQVVTSIAGRDRDKSYVVVVKPEAGYVLVANGGTRKVERPKRKNVKHLVVQPEGDQDLARRIASGESITDDLVRRALKRASIEAVALTNSKTKEAEA